MEEALCQVGQLVGKQTDITAAARFEGIEVAGAADRAGEIGGAQPHLIEIIGIVVQAAQAALWAAVHPEAQETVIRRSAWV